MATQNAQTRVCSIAELVEAILYQADLPPLDLLLARRINRTFNDVILHSLPCRRTLFLEPDLDGTDLDIDPTNVKMNPFLRKIFPKDTKEYFDLALDPARRGKSIYFDHEDIVMQGRFCKDSNSTRRRLAHLENNRCFVHIPVLETRDIPDYFTRAQWYEHAIWRRMYATRPALSIHVVRETPLWHRWEALPKTLGEIVAEVVEGQVIFSTPEDT